MQYTDKTTKLKNRNYFIEKLIEYFDNNQKDTVGVNILASLENVKEANKKIGYLKVDEFLFELAQVFKSNIYGIDSSIIARMNGSEFCFFLPNCSDKKALQLAKKIQNDVNILIYDFNLQNLVTFFIGLYGYNHCNNVSSLLSESDKVLDKAKLNRNNLYQKSINISEELVNIDEYKKLITKAISLNNFYFISFKAIDIKNKKIIHNRLSLSLKYNNSIYRYSEFMPIVKELGLLSKVYTNLLEMIFKTPDETLKGSICSIRLPYDYLVLEDSYINVENILNTYQNKLEFELIVEIPDEFAYNYPKDIKRYKNLLKTYHIEIGIYEFTAKHNNFEYLYNIKPCFLKGDSQYILDLNDNINIPLIATNVKDKNTLRQLEKKGIYFIQGSVVQFI